MASLLRRRLGRRLPLVDEVPGAGLVRSGSPPSPEAGMKLRAQEQAWCHVGLECRVAAR